VLAVVEEEGLGEGGLFVEAAFEGVSLVVVFGAVADFAEGLGVVLLQEVGTPLLVFLI
jgi:hypothetical protein